jgi:RHS repeat-associated protein
MTIRGLNIKRTLNDTTYYVHDATGNVMGIYVKNDLTLTTLDRPIYGSSRLGILNKAVVFNLTGWLVSKSNSTIGIKEYELSDHLGNVDVVILDRKTYSEPNFWPYFKSMSDYYPFGYPITSRTYSIEPYRYGFNGQEGDNEIYGDKLNYAFQYRMYDARIGRFWSVDPLNMKFAYLSTFQFASNNPIWMQELEGLEGKPTSVTGMDYEKLEDNYQKNGQKILNAEGSSLGYLANKKTNTCAIRLSESMNKSGYKVPSSKETPDNVRVQTGNKNDSGNFVLDAKSMSNYLNSIEKPTYKFTNLTTDKDIENAIEIIHKSDDLKGIIVLTTDNVNAYGATGHVDLIYEDIWWDLSFYSYDGYDLINYLKEHKSINFTLEIWVLEED